MKLLISLIGLVLVVEGIPYFAFPEKMKELMAQMQQMPPVLLRIMGGVSLILGLGLCYLAQRTSLFP